MAAVRIAILECDTPIESLQSRYPSYSVTFQELLRTALEKSPEHDSKDISVSYSSWDVVNAQKYPAEGEFDSLLLTGSKHNAFDEDEWIVKLVAYLQDAHQRGVPIVGICFGHQIIARSLGAQVGRSTKGWEVAVEDINLSPRGQELLGKASLALHQMHRDVVLTLPSGVENLGSSPRCDIQGLYLANRVFTVQAHPEFNDYIMDRLLERRHAQGVFDDAFYGEAAQRSKLQHDGVLVATAIWKFLLADRALWCKLN